MYEKRLFKSLSQANAEPLKDHLQLQAMIDILSKQYRPHIILKNCPEKRIQLAMMASLQQRLTLDSIPKTLQNAQMVYFDTQSFELSTETTKDLEAECNALCTGAREKNHSIIFVIPLINLSLKENPSINCLRKLLKSIFTESQVRLIILAPDKLPASFNYLKAFLTELIFIPPSRSEKIALLKSSRAELETFHQVTILDEVFPAALEMANKYLPDNTHLNSALELLDSAAARGSLIPTDSAEHKPIVTRNHLALVLSNQTLVPLAHLQNPSFQISKFIEAMQQRIFGHDAAIQAVASLLQTASLTLHGKTGPHCSFLFAGPACVGKATLSEALADYLFGHKNALLHVKLAHSAASLRELSIILNNSHINLLDAIEKKPYAVLLLENSDQYSAELIEDIKMVLAYGYALSNENKKIDFRHAIIIMTTTIGADCILNLNEATPEKNKTLDILQLVLNESTRDTIQHPTQYYSITELRDELTGALAAHFSSHFLDHLHVIPFIPLDYASLEKIMQAKIKALTKRLLMQFNIELMYAPEVVKFLAQQALWQRSSIKSLDHWLEQQLYSYITHEILTQPQRKDQSKQLLVRLHESGQLLRCEFIVSNETTLYDL